MAQAAGPGNILPHDDGLDNYRVNDLNQTTFNQNNKDGEDVNVVHFLQQNLLEDQRNVRLDDLIYRAYERVRGEIHNLDPDDHANSETLKNRVIEPIQNFVVTDQWNLPQTAPQDMLDLQQFIQDTVNFYCHRVDYETQKHSVMRVLGTCCNKVVDIKPGCWIAALEVTSGELPYLVVNLSDIALQIKKIVFISEKKFMRYLDEALKDKQDISEQDRELIQHMFLSIMDSIHVQIRLFGKEMRKVLDSKEPTSIELTIATTLRSSHSDPEAAVKKIFANQFVPYRSMYNVLANILDLPTHDILTTTETQLTDVFREEDSSLVELDDDVMYQAWELLRKHTHRPDVLIAVSNVVAEYIKTGKTEAPKELQSSEYKVIKDLITETELYYEKEVDGGLEEIKKILNQYTTKAKSLAMRDVCPVCRDEDKEHRVLSCGHSVCHTCLKQLISKKDPPCPECRAPITHPAESYPIKKTTDAVSYKNRQLDKLPVATDDPEGDLKPLLKACYEGNAADLRSLLEKDVNLDLVALKHKSGKSALHFAKSAEIAELLMNHAYSPQKQRDLLQSTDNKDQHTPLHAAAIGGRTNVVKYLCGLPCSDDEFLRRKDIHGQTALHMASNEHIAKDLIQSAKEEDRKDFMFTPNLDKQTVLHTAVKSGKTDVVKYLCELVFYEELAFLPDTSGRIALHYAFAEEIFSMLMEAVKDKEKYLFAVDDKSQNCAMHFVECGQVAALSNVTNYMEQNRSFWDLLTVKNSRRQNIFHLLAISPKIREFSAVWENLLYRYSIYEIIVPDIFHNTPLHYVAGRFSAKIFAGLVMEMPLVVRRQYLNAKNVKGMDCRSYISEHICFDTDYYMQKILCIESEDERDYCERFFGSASEQIEEQYRYPEKYIPYTADLFRVLKYALNEYSLSLPQLEHDTIMLVKFGDKPQQASDIDDAISKSPSALWLDIDTDGQNSDTKKSLQAKVNAMDRSELHGEPKVVIVRGTQDAFNIFPPGPDFVLIHALYRTKSKKEYLAGTDLNLLLQELKGDDNLRYANINSTMGRQYVKQGKSAVFADHNCPLEEQLLIDGQKRGLALIIYNPQTREEELQEVNSEAILLSQCFGLKTEIQIRLNADEICTAVDKFAHAPGHGSLVVLSIIAGGDLLGGVAGEDRDSVISVQRIVDSLCIPELESKTKIIFLSFARGRIGKPRSNRTEQSWECTTLPSLYGNVNYNPSQIPLLPDTKEKKWRKQLFPGVEVPENCYICYSTLPDSRSQTDLMPECFVSFCNDLSIDFGKDQEDSKDAGEDTQLRDRSTKSVDNSGESQSVYVKPMLPRVELISLFTDVAALVRERSQFTQYMNYCYKLTNKTKPVVVEILPAHLDHYRGYFDPTRYLPYQPI